ncbi:sodium:proton antiporter [Rathayibacter sp. YIM 133350]|uniref:cation:proton antiporter n=1 Tax=Rathayibacter sp. YIM 133350 TaxID=3131992 RepID=UPI00307E3790
MDVLIIGVLAVFAIVLAAQASTRLRVAAPLVLVVLGIGVSLLPIVPEVHVEPEWILAGVLPPLLYSAAVSMPTMEFRRDFRAISGLSVVLVVISSVGLGLLFAWLITGLGVPAGIALGAIISPTDAVATTIVKQLGVSPRIVAVLEGESLLNDATALVVLRSAIAATATSISFWGVVGDFFYAVAVAVAIGLAVGLLNLRLRSRVRDAAVNTAVSFTIPFVASIPAELLGASGLVAAVTAGIITGRGAARWLTPQHRLSDAQNWRTIELLLEGGVFLLMGLELTAILNDVEADEIAGFGIAAGLAALALVATLVIRAAYVAPLLSGLSRSARRDASRLDGVEAMQSRLDAAAAGQPHGPAPAPEEPPSGRGAGRRTRGRPVPRPQDAERFRTRLARFVADLDYMQAEPLGVREGTLIVWAGMRGVVTLAAAQTLPADTPSRSLLIVVAFFVAAASLLLQGGTVAPLARWLRLTGVGANTEERERLSNELSIAARAALKENGIDVRALRRPPGDDAQDAQDVPSPSRDADRIRSVRLEMIQAQRRRLLELRNAGTYSSGALTWALESLDADEISLELHSPGAGTE